MHGGLLCTLLARVQVARKSQQEPVTVSSCFHSVCSKTMSKEAKFARQFNSWRREGRDLMGGADGEAIDELLNDILDDEPGSEDHPSDCKHTPFINIH